MAIPAGTLIHRVRAAWEASWFAPESPVNLAVARVLAAAIALWVLLSQDRAAVSGLPSIFWTQVRESARWRYLLFPGHEQLEAALTGLAIVLLLGALLGVWPRICAFGSALILYHLAPLESIIWTTSPQARGLTLPLLTLLVCGIAPSGDALRIGWGIPATPAVGRAGSWRYGWPLRLIQLWLVTVYLSSGLAKLRSGGLAWASAENLSHWLRFMAQNELTARFHTLGMWLGAHPALAGAIGAGTLAFELACPAVLVWRRLRPWFAIVAILFHLGIYFTMNIAVNWWPLLLVFLDWGAIRDRWRARRLPA